MDTFSAPRLLNSGYNAVRRWTRNVDIFAYDIILVPVHVNNVHWCMAIINLNNKTIKYYDSLGSPNSHLLDSLEKYMKEESLDKRNLPLDPSPFIKENVVDCPGQSNSNDCGVFSCMIAEYIPRNSEITFSQNNIPDLRKRMILEITEGKLLL